MLDCFSVFVLELATELLVVTVAVLVGDDPVLLEELRLVEIEVLELELEVDVVVVTLSEVDEAEEEVEQPHDDVDEDVLIVEELLIVLVVDIVVVVVDVVVMGITTKVRLPSANPPGIPREAM